MISAKTYERKKKMSKETSFNYYSAYEKQAAYAEEIVLNLVSAIEKHELGSKELIGALHTIENDADEINHSVQAHLLEDFVVPLERTGMSSLAHALDDVTDATEQIAIDAYIRGISKLPSGAATMIDFLSEAVVNLRIAVGYLRSFGKNRDLIKEFCIKVQSFESECDALYIDSARAIYDDPNLDDRACRNAHALMESIERAMDAAENAAERIEAIVEENA